MSSSAITSFDDLFAPIPAGSAASVAPTPVVNVTQRDHAITVDAIYLNALPSGAGQSKRHAVMLIGIDKLAPARDVQVLDRADNVTRVPVPLYTAASKNGRAIYLNVLEDKLLNPGVPAGTKPAKGNSHAVPRVADPPVLLYNGKKLDVSTFGSCDAQPGDLARVFNMSITPDGFCNVTTIVRTAFDAENKLPADVRLPWALPVEQQLLPQHVTQFPTLSVVSAEEEKELKDSKTDKARKDQLRLKQRPENALPVGSVLVSVNRDLVAKREQGLATFAEPAVISERFTAGARAVMRAAFEPPPESWYYAGDVNASDDAKKIDGLGVRLSLRTQQRSPSGEKGAFMLTNMRLFARDFVGLGLRYPRAVDALLKNNSIPFYILASVDVAATARATVNAETADKRVAWENGLVMGETLLVQWRLRDYLLRHGIPVPDETLQQRFGGLLDFSAPTKPSDFDAILKPRTFANNFTPPEVKNVLSDSSDHPSGIYALDEAKGRLPDSKEFLFFVAPLFPLKETLPRDPATGAVALTAEEGHKLVMSYRAPLKSNSPSAKEVALAWLQPGPDNRRIPLFAFYAVRRDVVAAVAEFEGKHSEAATPRVYPEAPYATLDDIQLALLTGAELPLEARDPIAARAAAHAAGAGDEDEDDPQDLVFKDAVKRPPKRPHDMIATEGDDADAPPAKEARVAASRQEMLMRTLQEVRNEAREEMEQ